MNLLLSHPTGNRNVRQALQAFQENGSLRRFCTTVSWKDGAVAGLIPHGVRAQLMRRSYDPSLWPFTRTHPLREFGRLASSSLGLRRLTRHETGPCSIDAVCQSLDRWVASQLKQDDEVDTVYCYEDAALRTFQTAKSLGKKCIYEHPVGYWRDVECLFEKEQDISPDYLAVTSGINDSLQKREKKDCEIDVADLVIVPSHYSERTLLAGRTITCPIAVVNYGAPEFVVESVPERKGNRLQVLFAGSLQQRKGISYLIDGITAVANLVDMHVIGHRVGECKPVDNWLNTCSWHPTLPHAEVLSKMRSCDVLILPSLSEGFGLVVLEAMSQGMTVIVSENTGAADVVDHGINGYIVPIRSPQAISHWLEELAGNPDRLASMQEAARQTALQCTWESYRQRLIDCVRSNIGNRN